MESNYDLLISKINAFTRKFYLNKLLRGSIYTLAFVLALYLLSFLLVYFLHPGVLTKTVIFFVFIFSGIYALAIWVIKPLIPLMKLSKGLSLEESAAIIGNHFFTVQDKLLNTLQLKALAEKSPQSSALILAGIDQKIVEMKPIPFSSAIHFADNRKYLKYLLIPVAIILFIAVLAPAMLHNGTYSFLKFDQEILPEAPFTFELPSKLLSVTQGDNLTITLKLNGNELPQDVYVYDGQNTYKLEKQTISSFRYTFQNLQHDMDVRFTAGGFSSKTFHIAVMARPAILAIQATLRFPAYLGRNLETINNAGDLTLPEGTLVTWKIATEHTSSLLFKLNGNSKKIKSPGNKTAITAKILQSGSYLLMPERTGAITSDSVNHELLVIKDQLPEINVKSVLDSSSNRLFYFTGTVADDHGFSALAFHYTLTSKDRQKTFVKKLIPIRRDLKEQAFSYTWNLNELNIGSSDQLEYYFDVADNDGVNGAKHTRTAINAYQLPTAQLIAETLGKNSAKLKAQMDKAIKQAKNIEKDSKKIADKLLDKQQVSFDDKKEIEALLNQQKELDETLKNIKSLNSGNNEQKEANQVLNEELLEKQKQLDHLLNDVLDDKTKQLLEKLQRLMNQNNKDQTKQEISKMQMDNKTLKNEMDRILELYKQLEFDQELKNKIDRLNELSKAQKDLSKESTQQQSSKDLQQQQDKLTKDFEQLKKELNKLQEKNQQLERPNEYKTPEKETDEISKKQQESQQMLNQNQKDKAAKTQQQAGDQMQQLAQKLSDMQQQFEETENNLNAQEIRKLLENVLSTSFDQEKVMLTLRKMNSTDPAYNGQVQKQKSIKDNMKTIADSLSSLSKRVPQIESTVTAEVQTIGFNMDKSLTNLGDRLTSEAYRNQQYVMTGMNNLALMLNEVLDQLQNQKNQKGGGKGKKQQSMQQLQKMQEQLNNNMQKAKDEMQKNGNQGNVPKGQMSEQFAKMAQQQQMIREAMQKINQEQNKDGKGKMGNLNQLIKDMALTERELVNKRIEQETINRQRNLLTKMLDAEQAQREKDEDSKRESKAGKPLPPAFIKMIETFRKTEQTQTEQIRKVPPKLNDYYKNKISTYFKSLNSGR